jgi:hypothetical protein
LFFRVFASKQEGDIVTRLRWLFPWLVPPVLPHPSRRYPVLESNLGSGSRKLGRLLCCLTAGICLSHRRACWRRMQDATYHQRSSNFPESWYRFIASVQGPHHSLHQRILTDARSSCFSWDDDLSISDRIASRYSFEPRARILANMDALLFVTNGVLCVTVRLSSCTRLMYLLYWGPNSCRHLGLRLQVLEGSHGLVAVGQRQQPHPGSWLLTINPIRFATITGTSLLIDGVLPPKFSQGGDPLHLT